MFIFRVFTSVNDKLCFFYHIPFQNLVRSDSILGHGGTKVFEWMIFLTVLVKCINLVIIKSLVERPHRTNIENFDAKFNISDFGG